MTFKLDTDSDLATVNTNQLLDAPDTLARCLVAENQVRAVAVQLGKTWTDVLGKRQLPPAVQALLGELCAAAPLLAATLKLDGAVVLQLQGDAASPIKLMVVEYTAAHTLRAAVKLNADFAESLSLKVDSAAANSAGASAAQAAQASPSPSPNGLQALVSALGSGRFIVVLDPTHKMPGQKPYTSLVPIVGDSVATSIDYYMSSSEQLPTRVLLAANGTHCAGLLVQRMPLTGGKAAPDSKDLILNEHGHEVLAETAHDDTWLRMKHLVNTVKNTELLAISPVTLLRRLFWQEAPEAADSTALRFYCGCSRQKVQSMLKMLGAQEVNSVIAELGIVEVNCDYCDTQYRFDAVDCAAILAEKPVAPASGAVH
jgi:molecular chaperone Hsp33